MNIKDKSGYEGDYCRKYFPRCGFETFCKDIANTQDELIQYMPQNIKRKYKDFNTTQNILTVIFWTVDIAFITFCHKINLLKKMLPNPWAMFLFKIGMIAGPLYFMMKIEKEARREINNMVFGAIKYQYRRYIWTGDVLCLNPKLQITQSQLL